LALTAAIGLGLGIGIAPLLAAQVERLVINPNSGLAISGFDPVAYFTDQKAMMGRPDIELTLNGAVWRFLNEGNRAAFKEHPEVYSPQFGGYDAVAIDRMTSVRGHPLIWALSGERLYFFYNESSRAAFLDNPGRIAASATRKWPEVARTIGR
jgi:YHS domain-containing protein